MRGPDATGDQRPQLAERRADRSAARDECGKRIADAVRDGPVAGDQLRPVERRCLRRIGEDAGLAVPDGGRCHEDLGARRGTVKNLRRLPRGLQRLDRPGGEPRELEGVGCQHVGEGEQPLSRGARGLLRDVEPFGCIAEDGIDDDARRGRCGAQAFDQPGRERHMGSAGQVAREHRVDPIQPAVACQCIGHVAKCADIHSPTRHMGPARVIGQLHRGQLRHGMAERLQHRRGGRQPHMAVRDPARHCNDMRHGRTFGG